MNTYSLLKYKAI